MKAYEVISSPDKWTQGVMCLDEDDKECSLDKARKWCVLAAIYKAYPGRSYANRALNILEKLEKDLGAKVTEWNDSYDRTWQEVYDKLKNLDI